MAAGTLFDEVANSSCIWSVFLGRCHSFVKFNLPRTECDERPMTKRVHDDSPMKLFEFGRLCSLRLSFGWVFSSKTRFLGFSMFFTSTIWSGRMLNLEIWPPPNKCTVEFKHIYTICFFCSPESSDFWGREAERWLRFCDLHLPGKIKSCNDALDEAGNGTSSDDCPMIREQKRGGRMLVRVTWRKMSTFFRNVVRNWSKLNKEVWSWLARYFQLYIVYLLFQHQPVANS